MKRDNLTTKPWKTAVRVGSALLTLGLIWIAYQLTSSPASIAIAEERTIEIDPDSRQDLLTPTPPEPRVIPTPGNDVAAPEPADTSWAAPGLATLGQELLLSTDLETGSREFSGVTLNEDRGRILIVDDENVLYEFDLTPNGEPVTPTRRAIKISAGAGDIEGIAWIADTTYALAHENDGRLTIVTIDDDITEITNANVSRTIDTGIDGDDGKGIEGVAYLNEATRGASSIEFIAVQERPATLHLIGLDGTVASTIALALPDASGVWANSPDHITVVSDEGRTIVELQISNQGVVTVLNQLSLQFPDGRFEQPEGIAWAREQKRMYVVGEDPGSRRYSIGWWQAPS